MRARFVHIEVASARGIADRWLQQRKRKDGQWMREKDEQIHILLVACGPTISVDEAADIIGNKSWTHVTCAGCNESVLRAVRIGEDYSDGHSYCAVCIEEAHQVISGEAK